MEHAVESLLRNVVESNNNMVHHNYTMTYAPDGSPVSLRSKKFEHMGEIFFKCNAKPIFALRHYYLSVVVSKPDGLIHKDFKTMRRALDYIKVDLKKQLDDGQVEIITLGSTYDVYYDNGKENIIAVDHIHRDFRRRDDGKPSESLNAHMIGK